MSYGEYGDDYSVPGGNQDLLGGYARVVDHLSALLDAAPGIEVRRGGSARPWSARSPQ